MIIGVPNEGAGDETRVAMIPSVAAELIDDGHTVYVAADAGNAAGWTDDQYEDAGCTVVDDSVTIFEEADIITQVRGPGTRSSADLPPYQNGQTVVGLLGPYDLGEQLNALADHGVSAFAIELLPRISRAQSMDALSSMSSIGGYKAAIMAAERLPKMFPMEMTAAGTVQPAEVFVIGAGIAGLKAIATANRLGASVRAYDIRLETKQEVQSVGAEFVELDLETEGSGDDEGYAREMDEEFYAEQRRALTRVLSESDVVISTAAIPGKPAPELVTEPMVEKMPSGSVIIDLAASTGGNCVLTQPDETLHESGVTIMGPTNLPATVPTHASQLYSNNIAAFLDLLLADEGPGMAIDTDDEIIESTLITHDGQVRWQHPAEQSDES